MRRIGALLLWAAIPLGVLAVFFVVPVAGMLQRGFFPDGQFAGGEIIDVLTRPRTRRVLGFTVFTAGAGTAVSLLAGLPTAWVLYRLRIPGQRVIRALLLVPFVLPTVVVGVAFQLLFKDSGLLGFLGWEGSPIAIILALAFFNVAVVTRTVGATWESLDTRPAEAAASLGAGPITVFRTVTWPALRPSIVAVCSVVFLFCATSFGVVLTLGGLRYATIESEIYLLTTNLLDLQGAAVLSLVQLFVVAVLLVLAGKLRRTPDPAQARTTARPRRPAWRDAPLIGTGLLVLLALALPIGTLVAGSLRVEGEWSVGNYRALGSPGDNGALLVPATEALANSFRIAVDATVLAMALGLVVAYVVSGRSRSPAERRLRGGLDAFFLLPLGVSAVTVGFGFLVTLDEPPLQLRDTPVLVPIAQALVALPLVVRTIAPVLQSVDSRQREAAAALGASPLRQLLSVDLPVLRKPVLAAAGFALAASLGEFGATAFIARDDHPTLPVVIYRLIGHPGEMNYGMALAASVILAGAIAAIMGLVESLRVRSVGAW